MTLEQLRIFVAVAERQHVTEAARALDLTQSAVSNAVAALEARHGVRLFDRIGRGVVLNEIGHAFLTEAQAVLSRAGAAEAALADMGALRRGRLTVFASQTIVNYWLPQRLVAFHREYPAVQLDVTAGNTSDAVDAVRDGAVELGLVEGAVDDPSLIQQIVATDQLIVVVAPDHPWTAVHRLRREDLSACGWVARERGSGTRSTLEAALAARKIDPATLTVAMTLPTNEAVIAAVEAGAGVAAVSESVAAAALRAGRVVRAPLNLPRREFRLLRHPSRYRTRAAELFASALVSVADT